MDAKTRRGEEEGSGVSELVKRVSSLGQIRSIYIEEKDVDRPPFKCAPGEGSEGGEERRGGKFEKRCINPVNLVLRKNREAREASIREKGLK